MSGPPLAPPPTDFQQLGYAIPPEKPRTGMAIASLVCGILGLLSCLPAGIVGCILGIVATVRANRDPARYGGKGLAISGICTGGVSVLMVPVLALMISIMLPSLARAREITKRAVSASNLRGIGQAAMVYAFDNGKVFPPNFQTLITDGTCTPRQLINPSSGRTAGCDYYYVTGLTSDDPRDWIVAYEDPNQHQGEGANVLYVDGTVQFLKEKPGGQFAKEIGRFKAAYESKRGQPPQIIAPG